MKIKKPDGRPVFLNTYEKGAQSFCVLLKSNHRTMGCVY
jgi:hypothetical protein